MRSRNLRGVIAIALLGVLAALGSSPAATAGADDPAHWTFTIDQSPANPVPVDSPVTVTVTVTDAGVPVAGVPVDFLRTGNPGQRFPTDANGVAQYVLALGDDERTATVVAVVRSPSNSEVMLAQLAIVIEGEPDEGPCCTPQGGLTGRNSANGRADVLTVAAFTEDGPLAGATVDLFRRDDARWHQVGDPERILDHEGTAVFRVRDRNGRLKSAYKAVVGETETTPPGETQVLRLR